MGLTEHVRLAWLPASATVITTWTTSATPPACIAAAGFGAGLGGVNLKCQNNQPHSGGYDCRDVIGHLAVSCYLPSLAGDAWLAMAASCSSVAQSVSCFAAAGPELGAGSRTLLGRQAVKQGRAASNFACCSLWVIHPPCNLHGLSDHRSPQVSASSLSC